MCWRWRKGDSLKENKGEKNTELQNHSCPRHAHDPERSRRGQACLLGKHLFNQYVLRACNAPNKPAVLTGDPGRAGETGPLAQPPGERLGSIADLDERRHSLLGSTITERVNNDGEELSSAGSPMGGSPPTGFLSGRERLGGLRQGMLGWVCYSERPRASKPLGQSLAPRATGLSSFFCADIMSHLLEEKEMCV